MAQQVEPMDIDSSVCDFDNKENSLHHSNVLPRTPCTEKGFEELDVSELNMKLRYSLTPASSPMSKSFTANCLDNRNLELGDDNLSNNENCNLTRSLHSTTTKNDSTLKTPKMLPLQALPADQYVDGNRNAFRPLDSNETVDKNITVTVTEIDENISLPSSSSSMTHTPEATTPTKEIHKQDGGSPILRGLKSVLNMFRPSQSPIPPVEEDINAKAETLSPPVVHSPETPDSTPEAVLASTPLAARGGKDLLSKVNASNRDSITFNDDLEKELQWKDETTIIFSKEKIPIHKLFFPPGKTPEAISKSKTNEANTQKTDKLDSTVEYMDISYNESLIKDKTVTEAEDILQKNEINVAAESDSEFQDCESTFTKNESQPEFLSKSEGDINVKSEDDVIETDNKQESKEALDLDATKESVSTIASSKTNNSITSTETATADDIHELQTVPAPTEVENVVKQEEFDVAPQEALESKIFNIPVTSVDSKANMSITKKISEEIKLGFDVTQACDSKSSVSNDNAKIVLDFNSVTNVNSETEFVNDKSFKNPEVDTVPTLENLIQIPLIADPRVLLFNIPSENVTDNKVVQDEHLETLPADVPLPDDDDVEKLASLQDFQQNFELNDENLPIQTINLDSNQAILPDKISVTNAETESTDTIVLKNNYVADVNESLNKPNIQLDVKILEQVQTSQVGGCSFVSSVSDTSNVIVAQDIKISADNDTSCNTENNLNEIDQASINKTLVTEDAVVDTIPEIKTVPFGDKDELPQLPEQKIENCDNNTVINEQVVVNETVNIIAVEQDDINNSSSYCESVTTNDKKTLQSLSHMETNVTEQHNIYNKLVSEGNIVSEECAINETLSVIEDVSIANRNSEKIPLSYAETNASTDPEVISESGILIEKSNTVDPSNMHSSAVIQQNEPCCSPISDVKSFASEDRERTPELFKPGIEFLSVTDHVYAEKKEPLLKDEVDIVEVLGCNNFNNQLLHEHELAEKKEPLLKDEVDVVEVLGRNNVNDQLSGEISAIEDDVEKNTEIATIDKPTTEEIGLVPILLSENMTSELTSTNINLTEETSNIAISKVEEFKINEELNTTQTEMMDISANENALSDQVAESSKQTNQNTDNVAATDDWDTTKETLVFKSVSKSKEEANGIQCDTNKSASPNLLDNSRPQIIADESKIETIKPDVENAVKEELSKSQTSVAMENNDKLEKQSMDEEIVASENSSPFVSVSADLELLTDATAPTDNFEEIENPFVTKTKIIVTPPVSPKIQSKGYNFNFDEIDDPFATKTKIRLSPPPGVISDVSCKQNDVESNTKKISNKDFNKNRRKSQPERKLQASTVKKMNSTFAGKSNTSIKTNFSKVKDAASKAPPEEYNIVETKSLNDIDIPVIPAQEATENNKNVNVTFDTDTVNELEIHVVGPDKSTDSVEQNKSLVESIVTYNETKATSSSEQSTYYSAGTSSNEGIEFKNVFNLPEIDDKNFNPFATKNKVRDSPPRNLKVEDPNANKESQVHSFTDATKILSEGLDAGNVDTTKIDVGKELQPTDTENSNDDATDKLEEKDVLHDLSSATCSSKATDDRDITVREVHTEDEDTVEGPFLEAEDLDEKATDCDDNNTDMIQFSDIAAQGNENVDAGELFIDAEAFEFLLNQNKANTITDSGKESLFLKFDPLFAKRLSSDGVFAALNKVQRKQSTPKKSSKTDSTFVEKSPVAGPSNLNVTQDIDMNIVTEINHDDLNVTVSKPMMVVNPAVNPVVTPRNKTMTPPRANRRSLTFTSPAIAVIDRLLSMSTNNSFASQNTSITEVNREPSEADLALTQLRELLADKEINVYNLRSESNELKERLSALESQMKTLEAISEERLKKINELTEKLSEKTKINKSMATVVEEYERTIASLIAETEQDKKRHAEERMQLIKDRDEQAAHLASMEASFSDLHSKYEKSKQVILGFKANEDSCKKSIKEFEENLAKMQNNYELLKQHATSKLNHANEELQKMNRAHEAEVLKLNAMIKRKELQNKSLEETLAQKTKANEELTAICDELINKVG